MKCVFLNTLVFNVLSGANGLEIDTIDLRKISH